MADHAEHTDHHTYMVTRDELKQLIAETEDKFAALADATNRQAKVINIQAEILGFHRYVLEKFVPEPLFTQAAQDYKRLRTEALDQEAKELTARNAEAHASGITH